MKRILPLLFIWLSVFAVPVAAAGDTMLVSAMMTDHCAMDMSDREDAMPAVAKAGCMLACAIVPPRVMLAEAPPPLLGALITAMPATELVGHGMCMDPPPPRDESGI